MVERTLAWLNRFRRLTIRYELRADIHEAFVILGCALICLKQIRRFGAGQGVTTAPGCRASASCPS